MTPMSVILCDFDGTIVPEDVTDALLERFALPEWQILEQDWRAGRIGSRACMAGQVELLRVTTEELNRYLDSVEMDPAFPAFVAHVLDLGWKLVVVSDGIDYAIHRILRRYGLGHIPVLANHLECLAGGRYRLTFPHANQDCKTASGTCKCGIARREEMAGPVQILVGDGTSDFCVATAVQVVLAKDRLLHHCRMQGLPHLPFTDFDTCLAILASPAFAIWRTRAGLSHSPF
ncbi:MAG: MtnX-like HAD-IB family phosphatase [Magnetococcales bacterium]|nr:MtnX-like HAD-IB family phosphatase [Magnetococcales bacterium]